MKIAAVQYKPEAGNKASNIAKHLTFIGLAAREGLDLVFFSELSITGYEPDMAASLATTPSDSAFDLFQAQSDAHNITIGIGLPLSKEGQVQIGMLWFTPNQARRRYAKQQLHVDEEPFFVPGEEQLLLSHGSHRLAPAICYESLQPSHAQKVTDLGAQIYLASVAKPAGGLAKAMHHYPGIAQKHGLYVIMANCVGPCDNFISVGGSAAWAPNGECLAQMGSETEGLLIVDTEMQEAVIHPLS